MTSVELVRGRWVFTGEDTRVDGAIALQNDTILEVDSWETLQTKYPDAKVHGSSQFAILPGLINAHHHSNGVPNSLQGVDDDFLELWLFSLIGLRSQDPTLKTLLSTSYLLQSGVTSVLDVVSISGTPDTCLDDLQARLNAYEQAGMRVALAPGASYSSTLVHFEDNTFVSGLPDALQQRVQTLISFQQTLSTEEYLALISDLVVRYQSHPHIRVWFGPPGPQWVSNELMIQVAEKAAALQTGIQTHVVESFYENLMGPKFYGKSVVAHLHELGVLSPRFSMAHGVWLSEADIEILAETGASVSHNPSSNLRLRAGVAPLNALLQAGITVGLGMDGTALGDDEDMFAEMRLAARLHRTPQMQAPAPTLADVFHMATTGGAKLLMQEQSLGKLAPGYKADLVLVKCDRITFPWIAPEANPLHAVLMRARPADVDTVFVNGKIVLQDGRPTGFDLGAIAQEIADQMNASEFRDDYRALARELRPYLQDWYSRWEVPELKPYASFNSRI
ncbi:MULTISPECIES: amidohydrolase family protein [unclassified Leptolyngbya]|uniref:amidohydrolase family protein n=1 Tax=unclassified Leptolyngbya TaxID=2650499 RepID=UPI0016864C45|nr:MULTISPECIES: amidohydrolase family protein [unclassified Leptolyngbya]MBD1909841.1 amidohydrolase family protein [Leptolyngbya sp. FACHB-8]MBD2158992.1 amidohydrolase family protein [Leptolyngbya sp. FACHB-16]